MKTIFSEIKLSSIRTFLKKYRTLIFWLVWGISMNLIFDSMLSDLQTFEFLFYRTRDIHRPVTSICHNNMVQKNGSVSKYYYCRASFWEIMGKSWTDYFGPKDKQGFSS